MKARRKLWTVGWVLGCVVVISLGSAVFEKTATARKQAPKLVVPHFVPDPMWPKPLPNKWTTGQVSGVAVDSHDHIWVIQRPRTIDKMAKAAALNPPEAECCIPAPPVLEFDTAGNLLNAWGGPGPGYQWPENEHGIFVDYKGNVWIGGNGKDDDQILKFTSKGKFLLQIGRRGQNKGSNDTENLGRPAGIYVYPKTNEVFVADGYQNRRVIVFDADTGAYKRHWGAYGKRPVDLVNPPRQQIIQGPPPTFFNTVHMVRVSNDGLVYVADRANNRIQVFKLDGTFVKEGFIKRDTLQVLGTVYDFVFSPDKAQRYLYVADGANKYIRIVDRQTLKIVDSIGGHAGHLAGEFCYLHSIGGPDSHGNIYLGEVMMGQRFMRYKFTGMGAPVNPIDND